MSCCDDVKGNDGSAPLCSPTSSEGAGLKPLLLEVGAPTLSFSELASLTKETEADGGEKGGVEGSEGNIYYWKRLAELRKEQRRATGEARAKLWYAQRRGRNKHVAEKDEPIAERRAGQQLREPKEAKAVPQPLTVLKSIRKVVFSNFRSKDVEAYWKSWKVRKQK